MDEYRRYRNQALRLAKTLRKRFYNAKVKHLRQSDSRNWWRQMKRFTGQSKASELSSLANSIADGDVSALADIINMSLKRVSDDLQPLSKDNEMQSTVIPDKYIIVQETVLAKLECTQDLQSTWTRQIAQLANARLCTLAVRAGMCNF